MDVEYDGVDGMYTDDANDDSQEQTQPTQQASQPLNTALDEHLWGYLQPCSSALTRIDFWKIRPRYTIGRNIQENQVVLPGFKISNLHCTMTWDGKETHPSDVVVLDLSSNGTFINGVKIGKNQTRILREGQEIAFGTTVPQPANGGLEDYRFVYRHTAAGPPTTGLYAHYDLSTELGKGSFATVMKAISRATGKWYAVKMIHDKSVRSPGEQQHGPNSRKAAFAREISIMENLKHPNICELKEVFYEEDNNDISLVLELVEGGDLLEHILHNNGLPEQETKHITYQMCDALAYIHSQGVAHRDLKPENVLLTRDDPPIVKVADFGLAKAVDSLTMLRTMCGTPSYLAPEVVKQDNGEGYDNVVDSWSVGVIVFSMLTNSSPFVDDETQRDIRIRIAERRIDWSALVNPNAGFSVSVQNFVRCLLEENPKRRMTMENSLLHPWLQSYTPVYDLRSSSSISTEYPTISSISYEGSFPVNQEFKNMQIQPSAHRDASTSAIPGAYPNTSAMAGVQREDSRVMPLQRRSHVLSQAAEDGKALVEPSWEMVAAATAQDRVVGESHSNNSSKGQNKRVHSELTPLSEAVSVDNVVERSSPLSEAGSQSGGSTRGKGGAVVNQSKARNSRTRAGKSNEASEDEAAPPRRSGRHPPKVARRG